MKRPTAILLLLALVAAGVFCVTYFREPTIPELIAAINVAPDDGEPKRGWDFPPAVFELIDRGPETLSYMVELFNDSDALTRYHAAIVVEHVTLQEFGFVAGQGWPGGNREGEWREMWARLGGYKSTMPEEDRLACMILWRKEMRRRVTNSTAGN